MRNRSGELPFKIQLPEFRLNIFILELDFRTYITYSRFVGWRALVLAYLVPARAPVFKEGFSIHGSLFTTGHSGEDQSGLEGLENVEKFPDFDYMQT